MAKTKKGTGHSRGIQDKPKPKLKLRDASATSGIVCTWTPSRSFKKDGKGTKRCVGDLDQTSSLAIATFETPPKSSLPKKRNISIQSEKQLISSALQESKSPANTAVVEKRLSDEQLAALDDALVDSMAPVTAKVRGVLADARADKKIALQPIEQIGHHDIESDVPANQEAVVPTPASKAKGKGGGKSKVAGKGRGKSKAVTAKTVKQESRSNWTTSKNITYVIDPIIDFVHMFPHVKDQKNSINSKFYKDFRKIASDDGHDDKEARNIGTEMGRAAVFTWKSQVAAAAE